MLTVLRILLGTAFCVGSLVASVCLLLTASAGLAFIAFLLGQALCALVMPDLPSAED